MFLQRRIINTQSEMTRRITQDEANKINKLLEESPDIEEKISSLISANTQPKKELWEKEAILNDPLLQLYALLAFSNNLLDRISYTTIALFWSAIQCHKREAIETHFLFDETESKESQRILKQAVQYASSYSQLSIDSFNFSDEEFEIFLCLLKKLPVSEQRFFLVPIVSDTIWSEIEKVPFHIFGYVNNNNKAMLPSLGIMQTYLNMRCKYPVVMNSVMALSSLEDIRLNGLQNKRDAGLHGVGITMPKRADNFFAPWYLFFKHDFYHAVIVSCIPPEHRRLFIYLSDEIKAYLATSTVKFHVAEFLSIYAANLIDMEHVIYCMNYFSVENSFWASLAFDFLKTERSFCKDFLPNNIPYPEEYEQAFFYMFERIDRQYPSFNAQPHSSFVEITDKYNHLSSEWRPMIYLSGITKLNLLWKRWYQLNEKKLHLNERVYPAAEDIFQVLKELRSIPIENEEKIIELIKIKVIPSLSFRNVIRVFNYACDHAMRKLQQACMMYMTKNFFTMMEEKILDNFIKQQPDRFQQFISTILNSQFYDFFIRNALKAPEPLLTQYIDILLFNRNINFLYPNGYTLLDYAVELGRVEAVSMLLENGANPNPQKYSQTKPTLFSAIYHASGEIFLLLRRNGFDMQTRFDGKNWQEYFIFLSKDPDTYAGVMRDYAACLAKDPQYVCPEIETERYRLFCKVKNAARKNRLPREEKPILDKKHLLEMSEADLLEYTYEKVASDINFSCRRVK